MASKTFVQLIDDLDGSEASETIEFGIDGTTFEIDLNEENAEELRRAMAPWVKVGRRSSMGGLRPVTRRGQQTRSSRRSESELTRHERDSLRAWAAENGWEVAQRGRISREVIDAWESNGRAMLPE